MRIGILSDSHGRVETTRLAVDAVRAAGAEMLIHLGDFELEAVLEELVGMPARIVFGNCDWDTGALDRYARSLGIAVDDPAGRLDVGGRTLAYTHGHVRQHVVRALEDGVDYLLLGHTHELRDEQIGATRVINPGALFRAARYTAVVLDPGTGALDVLDVRSPSGRRR